MRLTFLILKMKMLSYILLYLVSLSLPIHCIKKRYVGIGEPNSPQNRNPIDFEDKWFLQKLDHFNPINNKTWKQRYQVNLSHYRKNGPIFLMIGGEGPISTKWMSSGAWIDYAEEFNALCFQLEHRYYGKSHPTKDMSTENLVYLSSEQALADLAEFIVNIQKKYEIPSSAKWVVFGGSYPGSLAAWLRMKYPHLVYAAVSSSGPLLAKIDFKEYFEVVENALSSYSPECVSQIKQANQMIKDILKTAEGKNIIQTKFKLCDPLNKNNKKDVENLFEILSGNFAEIVQYNKDNRYYQNSNRSSVTLETLCDIMVNSSIKTSLDRYAAVNSLLLSLNNSTCTDYNYDKMIDSYSNTSWNSDTAAGGRQWTYQTCTEFGFFQTSNQNDSVFSHQFPLDFFVDMCTDIFGNIYNAEELSTAVKRTNMMYGELNIEESRVIYVHGSVDPWHALGITQTKLENTVAIYIKGTAHCANMYPSAPTDLPQLQKARTTIKAYLYKWLIKSDSNESNESENIFLDF